jgi:hypothetical protein
VTTSLTDTLAVIVWKLYICTSCYGSHYWNWLEMSCAVLLKSAVFPMMLNGGEHSWFYGAEFETDWLLHVFFIVFGVSCASYWAAKQFIYWSHLIKRKHPCIYSPPSGEMLSWWVSGRCQILESEECRIFLGLSQEERCIYNFSAGYTMWHGSHSEPALTHIYLISANHIIKQVLNITSISDTCLAYGVRTIKIRVIV